uniref:SAP domain-containing protein n=1 Tax=Xiphophorus couchianus TaxID=32473 RepID=A0A3B5LRD6_9TELE
MLLWVGGVAAPAGRLAGLKGLPRTFGSLRVADLKAALEERGLSKSGQKNALIKRLKGVRFAAKAQCRW